MPEPSEAAPTRLERLLAVFTDVRRGEGLLTLVLAANIFLLLTAYYVIKPVREALILALDSGAEYKSYMSGVIAVSLLVLVPAYAKLVDRWPRRELVVGVTLFFAAHLVGFFALGQFESVRQKLGLAFYLWVGIFNLMVVAQLWSFANDLFDTDQGKRLFPLVALGASVGAALGSQLAASLVEPLGVFPLLLVGAGLLVACAGLFIAAERLGRGVANARAEKRGPHLTERKGAFALVLRDRYLFAIALFSLVFNWANSNGEYMLGKLVKADAAEAVARGAITAEQMGTMIGETYAEFFFAVNVLGVVLQALVVSRIVKHGGIAVALLVVPLITLANGITVYFLPLFAVLRFGKVLENATDYSLNNTVRHMLWLPTSYEVKFKAKQAVDTFFVRLGDVSSALLVYVGAALLDWSVRGFALANVALAAVWILIALRIVREHKKLDTQRDDSAQQTATANS